MALHEVVRYVASWRFQQHSGIVAMRNAQGSVVGAAVFNRPAEFHAVVDLLRNERPLFWDDDLQRLQTEGLDLDMPGLGEPVGEEETP